MNDEQSLKDQIDRLANKLNEAQHTIRLYQGRLLNVQNFLIQLTFFNEPAHIEQIRYRAKELLAQVKEEQI